MLFITHTIWGMSSQLFTEALPQYHMRASTTGLKYQRTLQSTLGVVIQGARSVGRKRAWLCLHTVWSIELVHLRWHSLGLSTVAARHGFWLKPGQQRSHDSPQVLCWHSHWSLQTGDQTPGFSDSKKSQNFLWTCTWGRQNKLYSWHMT